MSALGTKWHRRIFVAKTGKVLVGLYGLPQDW